MTDKSDHKPPTTSKIDLGKLKEQAKRRIDLPTKQGTYYVRDLRVGDMRELEPTIKDDEFQDAAAFGREVTRRLVSRSNTADNEPLSQSEFDELLSEVGDDEVAGVAAQAMDLWLYPGKDPMPQVGNHIRAQVKRLTELSRQVSDSYSSIGHGVQDNLSNLLRQLDSSAAQLGKISAPVRTQAEIRVPSHSSVRALDMTGSPLVQASRKTVEKLDDLATQMAAMANSQAELLRTIALDIVPKWHRQTEEAGRSARVALVVATASMALTAIALILSAVVPYHIEKRQADAADAGKREDAAYQARSEALQREHLDALRKLGTELQVKLPPPTASEPLGKGKR